MAPRASREKVALITGASSGIGKATALALAEAGFIVYASARQAEMLADLHARGCKALRLDVTDEASMVAAVRTIEEAHGAVSVLVNNAGYGVNGPLEELDLGDVRREFETNVFGLLRLSQLVLPAMRARGSGRIVNVGSVGGLFTAPGAGAYHASKYAVEALSDALRMEVRPFGIAVALIEPTGVRTAFVEEISATLEALGGEGPYATFKRNLAAGTRRLFAEDARGILAPEDVARVIVRAAIARRPQARYRVGLVAHLLPRIRHLTGDRGWDALMARAFPSS